MPPLAPASRGFVADVRQLHISLSPRTRKGPVPVLMIVGLVLVLAVLAASSRVNSEKVDMAKAYPVDGQPAYVWRVYVLNQTSRNVLSNGTAFAFKVADLPFDFNTLQFGDFQADTQHTSRYYGGCGILVNGSGTHTNITLREANGQGICTVAFGGQNPIVFSGERKSVSYPVSRTTYSGTERMIQDWRNATWSPDQGILVEHPSGLSLSKAELSLMIIEPSGNLEIPEFGPMLAGVMVCLTASILASKRRSVRKRAQ